MIFLSFLGGHYQLARISGSEIMERVSDSVCPTLDPSNITGDDVLIERNNESITVSDVEREFSLSVKDGLNGITSQIEPLERDILKLAASADESLTEDKFPRNH